MVPANRFKLCQTNLNLKFNFLNKSLQELVSKILYLRLMNSVIFSC